MAAKSIRLQFNYRKGFRGLRMADGVQKDIAERAQRVATAAGEGVAVLPIQQPWSRTHVLVGPVTPEAMERVATDNSLIRALEAGRG